MDALERIRQEARVIKRAPFSFAVFLAVGMTVGYAGSSWYYSKQVNDKDGQMSRYRVALGIDKASQGALIELNNAELQAKALNVAAKLEDMCAAYQKRQGNVLKDFNAGRFDERGRFQREHEIDKETASEFIDGLRADVFNLDNELRRRLGPKAVAAIVGISPSMYNNEDPQGTRIDSTTMILSPASTATPGITIHLACPLANAIEQMAKLLPPDDAKP